MDDVYMREKRKWDGYSYGKTIPSLQAYPQKITSKNGRGFFFCDGFPKEKGNTFFSEFSRDFSRISPLYFSIFLPIFFPFFSHIFLQKWGVFIGKCYTLASLLFLPHHRAILSFSHFLVQTSCSCLEAFSRSIFFKLYIPENFWMSSFQWF